MFNPRNPTFGDLVLCLILWYWFVACITWQVRNPIANPMTCFTRINHVVCYDKMSEYQVVKTDKSL